MGERAARLEPRSRPRWSGSTPSSTSPSRRTRPTRFEEQLRDLGKDATIHVHEGCDHAFFNDARPEVYSAEHALAAWERTLELFREELADEE